MKKRVLNVVGLVLALLLVARQGIDTDSSKTRGYLLASR
jgi:hypothetical protein